MDRPNVEPPSPMMALNEPSTRYETPAARIPVEVWVEGFPVPSSGSDATDPGWYAGELAEWTHYNSVGWTGWVRFSTAPAQRYNGRFLAAAIRQLGE